MQNSSFRKKYNLTNFKKQYTGWEKDFIKLYQDPIIELKIEVSTESDFRPKVLSLGIKNLKGIKMMANSSYSISSVLRMLYRDFPEISNEIFEKLKKNNLAITPQDYQLISAKTHEYHTFTEEMNFTMRLMIDFKKLKKNKDLKDSNYNIKTWNGILNVLAEYSKNNKFIEYLQTNKDLRNAIAHCSILYESGMIYYYPKELGIDGKSITKNELIKKTKELSLLVQMFFYIFTNNF